MKLIGIRIFGVCLIILSINCLVGGSWASIYNNFALMTYEAGKEASSTINTHLNDFGLINETDHIAFNDDFDAFQNRLREFNMKHLQSTPIVPYLFSGLSLTIAVPYLIAGIGTIRLKNWAKKSGLIAALIWPLFYTYVLFSAASHLKFVDSITLDSYKLLSYINLDPSLTPSIPETNTYIGSLIFSFFVGVLLFTVAPILFFLNSSVDEELL